MKRERTRKAATCSGARGRFSAKAPPAHPCAPGLFRGHRPARALQERKNTMREPADPMCEGVSTMREPVAHCTSRRTQCASPPIQCASASSQCAKPSRIARAEEHNARGRRSNARAGRCRLRARPRPGSRARTMVLALFQCASWAFSSPNASRWLRRGTSSRGPPRCHPAGSLRDSKDLGGEASRPTKWAPMVL
jgi:hypothetical protein